MPEQNQELIGIIKKFAESGWDLIDVPSKAWLAAKDNKQTLQAVTNELLSAVKKADEECGSCGCEFDPLYKKALALLTAA